VFVSGCTGKLKDQTARGDWDGFISMSAGGLKMKPDGSFTGHAWGADVVGWVDFSKVKGPVIDVAGPTVTVTANPTTGVVNVVNPVISYSATGNPTSCTAAGDWKTKPTSATAATQTQTQGVLKSVKTYTYSLTCNYPGGVTATGSATVVVTATPTACSDKKDNDGDGKIDMNDPGCSSPSDNDETDTTTPPGDEPGGGPGGTDEPGGPGGPGVGGQCSNIVDNPATIGVDESIVTFPPYRKLADGSCLCVAGYVLNADYQCVKPVYQEE
jgi:hypothetical protein